MYAICALAIPCAPASFYAPQLCPSLLLHPFVLHPLTGCLPVIHPPSGQAPYRYPRPSF